MKKFTPFNSGMKPIDIDWMEGTLRVIKDSSYVVIAIETKDGEFIVLNVIETKEASS